MAKKPTPLGRTLSKKVDDIEEAVAEIYAEVLSTPKKGDKGEVGQDGKDGKDGRDGRDGKDGKSIRGADGKDGRDGISIKGDKGGDGLSAYQIWLENGNKGTEAQFLESLNGKDGEDGKTIIREYRVEGGGGGGSAQNVKNQLEQKLSNEYVPYTGATKDVDLGSFELATTGNISAADPIDGSDLATKDYVDGASGGSSFTRTEVQFTSQTSISVTHNNGFKPAVTVLNSSGFERTPNDIEHISDNAFTVTFTSAQSGSIVYDSSGIPDGGVPEDNVTTISNTYTILSTDDLIICQSGTYAVTLPTAVGRSGKKYTVRHTGTGTVTLTGDGAELIDTSNTLPLASSTIAYTVQSDNTQWWIV